jgi:hypothetical protein
VERSAYSGAIYRASPGTVVVSSFICSNSKLPQAVLLQCLHEIGQRAACDSRGKSVCVSRSIGCAVARDSRGPISLEEGGAMVQNLRVSSELSWGHGVGIGGVELPLRLAQAHDVRQGVVPGVADCP